MRARSVITLLFACALACAACGGGGSGPTAPSGFVAIIATVLVADGGAPTIEEAKLVLDGAVVGDASSTTPALSAILLDPGSGIASGHHTLSVVIAAQSASPSSYQALTPDVSIFTAGGVRVHDIMLVTRGAKLATGQSIDYTFDF
jgi:hypothetical protein